MTAASFKGTYGMFCRSTVTKREKINWHYSAEGFFFFFAQKILVPGDRRFLSSKHHFLVSL
jgi:hypothetical protein